MKPSLQRWTYPLLLILVMGSGAVIRFWDLDRQSLWQDEIHTAIYVTDRAPLWTVVQRVATQDLHSPMYYVLLRAEVALLDLFRLPASGGNLRLLSAVLGTLALPAFYLLLLRLFKNKWYALLGLFFASLSMYGIYYSQELRMYALILLAAPLMLYFQLILWDAGRLNRWAGAGLVFTTVIMLYASLIGLFFVAGTWLGFLILHWLDRRDHPKRWQTILLLGGIAGLLYLPWAGALWTKSMALKDGVPTGMVITNPRELLKFVFENLLFHNFKVAAGYALINKWLRILLPLSLLFLFQKQANRRNQQLMLAGFFLTFIIYFGVTYGKEFHTGRYFSPWWPFPIIFLLLAFYTLDYWLKTKPRWRTAAWGLILAFTGFYGWVQAQGIAHYFTDYRKEDWRTGVAYLNQTRQPGDYLVVTGDWEKETLAYYGVGLPFLTFRTVADQGMPADCKRLIYIGAGTEKELLQAQARYAFQRVSWPVSTKNRYDYVIRKQ